MPSSSFSLYRPSGRASVWQVTKDGDPCGLRLYMRHYSCRHYKDGRPRRLFVGPGEKLVLVTRQGTALFAWRKFRNKDAQAGINCSVFRNESNYLSSSLIREAMQIAWARWPGERLYTYVNPKAIRSRNPGCCFRKAGWQPCGSTRGGLLVFEARSPSSFISH